MYHLLQPISVDFDFVSAAQKQILGGVIEVHTKVSVPDIEGADIVLIGVKDDRNAINNEGTKHAPDEIRKAFYQLFPGDWALKIVDIGNLVIGENIEQTYENLESVLTELLKIDKSIVVLGGSQDFTYPITKAFDAYSKLYNISLIDSVIDASLIDDEIDNENYLTAILSDESSSLHNANIIGLQTYYNHLSKYKIFEKIFVDYTKLSEAQKNLLLVEPELRDAHIVSMDVGAIKNAEFPAQKISKPNGFSGQEVCVLARQAGIAVQNKIFGVFEYNPFFDKNNLSANLLAQVLWYFIEGKDRRIEDYPNIQKKDLIKFHVTHKIWSIIFYKNEKTARWWVEINDLNLDGKLFSCSEQDYQEAVNQKISNRLYHIINKNTI